MPEDLPTAIVTGAGGLIGNELVRSAPAWAPRFDVQGLQRSDLDLTDAHRVTAFLQKKRPKVIIHCAAMSKSPACDANRELAFKTNVTAVRSLSEAARDALFVFFSTDLIFDGRKGDYEEADAPNPLMFYGETKALAEEIVRKRENHLILRISLTGGKSPTGDRGFNEEMKRAWSAGRTLDLFIDEYRAPMAAEITARAVWELVSRSLRGTFHLCSPTKFSRYDIGRLLAKRHPELNPQIKAGSRNDYQGPPRPADTSLRTEKIQRQLSFSLPSFADWLRSDLTGF